MNATTTGQEKVEVIYTHYTIVWSCLYMTDQYVNIYDVPVHVCFNIKWALSSRI